MDHWTKRSFVMKYVLRFYALAAAIAATIAIALVLLVLTPDSCKKREIYKDGECTLDVEQLTGAEAAMMVDAILYQMIEDHNRRKNPVQPAPVCTDKKCAAARHTNGSTGSTAISRNGDNGHPHSITHNW